jgi:hypothetical protein
MSGTGVVMMVLICGFVWGGLALLIAKAVRSESAKIEVGDDG